MDDLAGSPIRDPFVEALSVALDELPAAEAPKVQPMRRRTQKSVVTPPKPVRIKVDPRVWKEALRLSKGDPTRIVVRSATAVSVLNSGRKRDRTPRLDRPC